MALGLSACATNSPKKQAPAFRTGTTPTYWSQLDYPNVQLGNGSYTIGSSGCFLTSLTIASCMLHNRTDLNPELANSRVAARGGFSGSGLKLEIAAPALGLVVKGRSELNAQNRDAMNARLDAHLGSKRPVCVGIDIWPGRASSGESDADHFILIYGKSGDRYLAADPAGGRTLNLKCGDDGVIRCEGDTSRTVTEMIFLDKSALFR